jgi:hypothetical protein
MRVLLHRLGVAEDRPNSAMPSGLWRVMPSKTVAGKHHLFGPRGPEALGPHGKELLFCMIPNFTASHSKFLALKFRNLR